MCAPCSKRMGPPVLSLVPLKVFYLQTLWSFFLATVAIGLLTGGVVPNHVSLSKALSNQSFQNGHF